MSKPLIAFQEDLIAGVRAWEILKSMRTVEIHDCNCPRCDSDGEAYCAFCESERIERHEYDEHGQTMLYKCESCKRTMLSRTRERQLYDEFATISDEYNIPYPNRP